jgi:hypothetical protein
VHRSIPRHRRKAGSGPPANALIAWIGTDTYLRDAAATVSYRRWMALPMPSNTRSAAAAVVTCFALTCTAALGINAIISHGRATAQHKIATPPLFGQGGAPTHNPEASLALPTKGSEVSPVPADIAPMLVERAGSPSITVPPAAKIVEPATGRHLSSPPGNVSPTPTPAPVAAISSRHIDKPSNSGKLVAQVEMVAAGKPTASGNSGDTGTSSDAHTLLVDSGSGDHDAPIEHGTSDSAESANPAGSDHQDAAYDPAHHRDPAALTVPGAHRRRSDGAGGLPLSPRRSTPGSGSNLAHTPGRSAPARPPDQAPGDTVVTGGSIS